MPGFERRFLSESQAQRWVGSPKSLGLRAILDRELSLGGIRIRPRCDLAALFLSAILDISGGFRKDLIPECLSSSQNASLQTPRLTSLNAKLQ